MNFRFTHLQWKDQNLIKYIRIQQKEIKWFQLLLDLLSSMAQICQSQILSNAGTVLLNSAHGMFQYGQYYECLQQPGYNYNLVQLGIGGANAGIYYGFCLPQSCTIDIIKTELGKLLIEMQFPYSIYAVFNNIQDYQYPFNWVFYLTLIIISFMAFITLYATFFKSRINLIKAISLQQNMKIFKTKDSDLNVFNGVRSIAMMWVVFGHYYFNTITGILNAMDINSIFQKPFLLLIQGGLISVDVFFFLGGFFLSFVFMRQKKNTTNSTFLLAILQRMLRILPAYILTMMIYYSVFMHLGDGPRWPFGEASIKICSNMWRSIFFVDNIVNNGQEMCLDWGWYLQVDFQIFIVCLILLFLYMKVNKIVAYISGGMLIIGSLFFNIYFTYVHNQRIITDVSSLMNYRDYYLNVYIKPYARWVPYFMGLYAGIVYYQYQQFIKKQQGSSKPVALLVKLRDKLKYNKYLRIIIEWIGIGLMAFVVFLPRTLQVGHQWHQIWHSIFGCFSKPIFIIGMLMVVLPTILGVKNSFFKLLLDNTLLNFLAKISFCTYLLHLMVIIQYYNSRTYDIYYSLLAAFPLYLGCLVLSCFFGFLLTIFVELPFSVWQKELLKKLTNNKRAKLERNQEEYKDMRVELEETSINKSIAVPSIQQKL